MSVSAVDNFSFKPEKLQVGIRRVHRQVGGAAAQAVLKGGQPRSGAGQLIGDRHVLGSLPIAAPAVGRDHIRFGLEGLKRRAGILQFLAQFVELRSKPLRGQVGRGGFHGHGAVDLSPRDTHWRSTPPGSDRLTYI